MIAIVSTLLAAMLAAAHAPAPAAGSTARKPAAARPAERAAPRPATERADKPTTKPATKPTPKPARAKAPTRLPFDSDGPPIFLVGAEVRTGDGQRIADAVIELRGTRIASVGGPRTLPAGATRIDLAGKIVTPGLVAADSSIGLVEIDAEGATKDDERRIADPIRAAYDASTAVHADSSLIPINAIEGVTSAALTPRGGWISGQVAWIDLAEGDHAHIVSRRGIALRMSLGQAVDGSRAATWQRLRELFDDAAFYRTRRAAYDRNQSRELGAHRVDLEALVRFTSGGGTLVMNADRASDLRLAASLAREGHRVVVLGGTQAWRVADELAAAKVTVIVQPSQNLPDSLDELGVRLDNAALLAAAGVDVGIAVLGEAHNPRNMTQEAGLAISYGMDPDRALAAITSVPARAYGMDADYGSVAAGKVANLVVWDGDPFELSQRPVAVWIRGKQLPMRSRQTELRDRYLKRLRSPK